MNLLQKLGVTHDIKDYLLIIENSNTSSACVRFVRYVGLNEFLDLFSNRVVSNNEIDYYKHLTDYVVVFDDEEYETGEKRIYAPSVIFVRDGKVLGIHVSTVDSHEDPRKPLTDEQYEELFGIYEDYILEVKSKLRKRRSV
jgi:hypothetical protein